MQGYRTKSSQQRERRLGARHGTAQAIEFRHGQYRSFGTLIDVSNHGAQLLVPNGLVPAVGKDLTMRLLDGTELTARVRWSKARTIGVQFTVPLLDATDFLHFEHLGRDLYSRSIAMRRAVKSTG